jgi:hypothetical protein
MSPFFCCLVKFNKNFNPPNPPPPPPPQRPDLSVYLLGLPGSGTAMPTSLPDITPHHVWDTDSSHLLSPAIMGRDNYLPPSSRRSASDRAATGCAPGATASWAGAPAVQRGGRGPASLTHPLPLQQVASCTLCIFCNIFYQKMKCNQSIIEMKLEKSSSFCILKFRFEYYQASIFSPW